MIGRKLILLTGHKVVKRVHPDDFELEKSTVWSFPSRGNWATHSASYPGNWSPYIVRNILERYSRPGDVVLDPMVGGGTTLVECRILGRCGVGIDISRDALMVTFDRLNSQYPALFDPLSPASIRVFQGDARYLHGIGDASIDLITVHPPYWNILAYSASRPLQGDLSMTRSLGEFFHGMKLIADECLRVLKPGGHLAILVGDTHRHSHYVPISHRVLDLFLLAGFVLREEVIKLQWQTETMRSWWRPRFKANFLLTYHEHLFIFRRLGKDEEMKKFKTSMAWSV